VRLAVLLLVASCDWSLHRMQEQPRCEVDGTLGDDVCNRTPPEGTVSMEQPAPPPPVNRALVDRGRDRFQRFCAPCHGVAGDGDSYIARAMTLRRPPSLVDDPVTKMPDDRILTVITTGYGVMPSYASAIPMRDRYAILTYLRVLQSREVPLASLPPDEQQEAKKWLH
jgi:mono/diheme cytochrome c family protein